MNRRPTPLPAPMVLPMLLLSMWMSLLPSSLLRINPTPTQPRKRLLTEQ